MTWTNGEKCLACGTKSQGKEMMCKYNRMTRNRLLCDLEIGANHLIEERKKERNPSRWVSGPL